MIDAEAPQTIRLVNNFNQLNKITVNCPIIQPSTQQQIRSITANVKYLSLIDITGCFHSICLSRESQL